MLESGDMKEEIWHQYFGHLGAKNLQKRARDQLVTGLHYDVTKDINFCEPWVDGKHLAEGELHNNEIVHSDFCGKIEEKSLSGAEFIDDKSRF